MPRRYDLCRWSVCALLVAACGSVSDRPDGSIGNSFDASAQRDAAPSDALARDAAPDAACMTVPVEYKAFDQFSAIANPNNGGIWEYGFTQSLGSPLTTYVQMGSELGLSLWRTVNGSSPYVARNGTGSDISDGGGLIVYPANDFLVLHPGPAAEASVVRWTAPTAGTHEISTIFNSANSLGATTDVHVLHNAVSIFDGAITGGGDVELFSQTRALAAGDTIDFVVGDGGNGNESGSTGLKATVTRRCPD